MNCGKVILTKKEAVAAGKKFGKQRQYRREKRYYYCSICNGWHLTSMEEFPDEEEEQKTELFFIKTWRKLIKGQKKRK